MTRPPEFICIGAQKAGTTWLYEQLRRHPQIHIPAKEMNVFLRDLPLDDLAGAADQLVGDISPVYGAAPGIAAKIARACPSAKLIMLIRNPVERAWSQYRMAVRLGNIPRGVSFLDAFLDDRQWLQRRGRYAEIIGEFSSVAGPLLVLDFARIAREPRRLLADIYAFLGLDPVIDDACAAAVFAPSRHSEPIPADAADRVAAYYQPLNERLHEILPWRPGWL